MSAPYQSATNKASSGSSIACTFGAAVAAGSVIHVYYSCDSGSTVSRVRDNVNGAVDYTAIGSITDTDDQQKAGHYYFQNSAAGTPTVTLTLGGTGQYLWIYAEEVRGVVTTGALVGHSEQVTTGSGTGTDAVSSGTATFTEGNRIICAASANTSDGVNGPNVGTNYTNSVNSPSWDGASRIEYREITSGTSAAATFTPTVTGNYCTLCAVFAQPASTVTGTSSSALASLTSEASGVQSSDKVGAVSCAISVLSCSGSGVVSVTGSESSALTSLTSAASAGGLFPLSVSSDHRRLVDKNGNPYRLSTQFQWPILMTETVASIGALLDDLEAKGFNGIHTMSATLSSVGWSWPNTNYYGEAPFTVTGDLSTPNTAFWNHHDALLEACLERDFAVVLFYLYSGYAASGWEPIIAANTLAKCQGFGTWLGNRLKNYPNVILAAGGDHTATDSTTADKMRAILQAMRAAGCTWLCASEWETPLTQFDAQSPPFTCGPDPSTYDLNINSLYDLPDDETDAKQALAGWDNAVVCPAYLSERTQMNANYTAHDATREGVRMIEGVNLALAMAASNCGELDSANAPGAWVNHLNDDVFTDQANFNALYQQIAWHKLVPTGVSRCGRDLIVSANDINSQTYIAASIANDGTLLVVYVPPTLPKATSTKTFQVDLRSMAGPSRGRWWNPATGAYTDATGGNYTIANTAAAQSFTTPGNNGSGANDWVLLLDVQLVTGTVVSSVSSATSTAVGTVTASVSGTSTGALASSTSTASGGGVVTGTDAGELASLTSSESGSVSVSGLGSSTASDLTDTAAGTVTISGTESAAVAAATSTETGSITTSGTQTGSVASEASIAVGNDTVSGASSGTVAADASTATGSSTVSGGSTSAVASDTSTASGAQSIGNTGSASSALTSSNATAAATVTTTGTESSALASSTSTAYGGGSIAGGSTSSLASDTSAATGTQSQSNTGSSTSAVSSLASSASGELSYSGGALSAVTRHTSTALGDIAVTGDASSVSSVATSVSSGWVYLQIEGGSESIVRSLSGTFVGRVGAGAVGFDLRYVIDVPALPFYKVVL